MSGPYFDLVFDLPLNQTFTYRGDPKGEAGPGKRAACPFGRRDVTGYILGTRDAPPPGVEEGAVKSIRRVVDREALFGEEDIALAKWVAGYYFCSLGQALSAMIPSGRRAGSFPTLGSSEDIAESPLDLSEEQRAALDEITAVWGGEGLGTEPRGQSKGTEPSGGSRGTEQWGQSRGDRAMGTEPSPSSTSPASAFAPPPIFYLYGITGSGKTEVFLRAAERAMAAGLGVIYLVPEISLTHQTAEVIGRRFGKAAAAIHSGMSPGARLGEWLRIRRGEARIVVGPRSAVFAPVRRLGLIIIDEEHDGSYKSGNTPRYHARQVAMRRRAAGGGAGGAVLLMGSATPSAEAWKLMRDGGIRRLNLTRRLSGGKPPEITPVNLAGAPGCLTPELKDEIRKTALAGRQTILFLNRRGFAYFYHCPSCGFELKCRQCSVSLTWHKGKGRAVCHYCGYSAPPPSSCPECGSLEAGFTGIGTEMIEEEVRRAFPDLRVARADADTMGGAGDGGGGGGAEKAKGKDALKETLDSFRRGEIDLLLGTQMVAKGLNFPGVRLVGVVLADTGLQLPDFRAAERVFSLVVQVAGRSGRYFPDGKVIVQTLRPRDEAIRRSCALDVEGFFQGELAQREALRFPPYSRLIRFTVRSRDAARADKAAGRLAEIARPLLPPGADALGPAECPLSVLSGNHRRQLILRGAAMGPLHAAAGSILAAYAPGKDPQAYIEVDVDPVSLL